MRKRTLRAFLLAIGASSLLAGVAAAGGMATATLDRPPEEPVANEPMTMGFTLLQHGLRATEWGSATLHVIDTGTDRRTSFPATPAGGPGHWVADVIFPAPGSYRIEITHDLVIEPRNFGETVVSVAAGPRAEETSVGAALPFTILAASALLVTSILAFVLRPTIGPRRAAYDPG